MLHRQHVSLGEGLYQISLHGPIRMINNGELGMINEDMRAIIEAQRPCFSATVSPDGRPNLTSEWMALQMHEGFRT